MVDDGSEDETPQVLQRYAGRVRALRQPQRGVSSARNTGIGAVGGSYVALLDADDWWDPEKLTRQIDFLERNPAVGAIGCGRRHIGPEGRLQEVIVTPRATADRRRNVSLIATRRLWIGGSSSGAVIRRPVFDRVGLYDEQLWAAEDWDLWLRIAAEFPIDNLPDILTNIHRHGTGIFRDPERVQGAQWAVYSKAIRAWPEAMTPGVRRQMRALILRDAAGEWRGRGDAVRALTYEWRALAAWPVDRRAWWRALGGVTRLPQALARRRG